MRMKRDQIEFLKKTIEAKLPDARVFVFGSRAFDNRKGGDIDILVLAGRQLSGQEKRSIKIAFYKKFGEQKMDIVSFRNDASSTFKDLAMQEAVRV